MVNSDIALCRAEGFMVSRIDSEGLLCEAEVRRDGILIGLACPVGPQGEGHAPKHTPGFYAVDADSVRLPGTFATLVEACRALAEKPSEK